MLSCYSPVELRQLTVVERLRLPVVWLPPFLSSSPTTRSTCSRRSTARSWPPGSRRPTERAALPPGTSARKREHGRLSRTSDTARNIPMSHVHLTTRWINLSENARPSPFRPDALSGMLTRAWIVARTYPRGRAACKGPRVTKAAMAPSCAPSTRRARGSPLGTLIHPVALSGDHARTRLHALGLVEGRPGALRLHDGVTQFNLQNLFR